MVNITSKELSEILILGIYNHTIIIKDKENTKFLGF